MTVLFRPELGLPINPGAENPIQNAAFGEEGHIFRSYRETVDGVIPISEQLASGSGFISDNPDLVGCIDISNCSGFTLALQATLVALTSVDIYLRFTDRNTGLEFYQTILDGTLVATDYIYTVRKNFYRILASVTNFVVPIPNPNAKFVRIFIIGTGVNTGSSMIIRVGRGWLPNLGMFTV